MDAKENCPIHGWSENINRPDDGRMKYSVMMCDPPWPTKKGGKRKARPNQDRELDYPTMSMADIRILFATQLLPMMDNQHSLFMWVTERTLNEVETLLTSKQWTDYKLHCRFIWDKMNGVAPAFTVRFSHEYLLWLYRGKMMPIQKEMRGKFTTVFREKARQHSRKPDVAYDMVSALYPNSRKLDAFSREKRDGWDQWGNQIDHF